MPLPVQSMSSKRGIQPTFGLGGSDAPRNSLDDPLQDPHVLAEARPHEIALRVMRLNQFTQKILRLGVDACTHLQPVIEVVPDVIAAERQHRERVATHDALLRRWRPPWSPSPASPPCRPRNSS
jgi:hypothetical protein